MEPAIVVPIPKDGKTHVVITQICEHGHVMGQWLDTFQDKYPNYCPDCGDDIGRNKYPWIIRTQTVSDSSE